ncbi:MAG: formate dehydrogenase [Ruminococcaceae bacterium]|nr:formate dehydrogenase [Oscillospiraceae bacterium]
MAWELKEAAAYYKKQGAPGDQMALTALLREIQEEYGSIPKHLLAEISAELGTKESFLLALIRRQPRLRLGDTHTLELCAGPNCGKHTQLAALAEQLCAGKPGVMLRFLPCQRQCGKGPNIKWDGKLYNRADEKLLRQLLENA